MKADPPILRVRNLIKEFKLYDGPGDFVRELLFGGKRHRSHRVLSGVSLEAHAGEFIGLIGRNGAGKSTLLKIICGVLDYDAGEVETTTEPAPVLELGLGFDYELTGRDNARFGALCMGIKPADLPRKLEEIIEFSELRPIIDQPFRTYSTGQRMRLAFSAAMSLDTRLLIIDEALAVADILFQEKCISRIKEFNQNGGTVLFVSHSLQQLHQLCTRALLLEGGRFIAEGDPVTVSHEYERLMHRAQARRLGIETDPHLGFRKVDVPNDLPAYFSSIEIVDSCGNSVVSLRQGKRYAVRLSVKANAAIGAVSPGFRIMLASGAVVLGTSAFNMGQLPDLSPGDEMTFEFWFSNSLAAGNYLLSAGLATAASPQDTLAERYVVIDTRGHALEFSVSGSKPFYGVVDLVDELVISSAKAAST